MAEVMNTYTRIQSQVPATFQEDFSKLKNDFVELCATFESVFTRDDTDAKKQWQHEFGVLHAQLFEFVTLAKLNEQISCNDTVYICAQHNHISVIETALQLQKYYLNAKTLSPVDGLRDTQKQKHNRQPRAYIVFPVDIKKALENLNNGISKEAYMSAADNFKC